MRTHEAGALHADVTEPASSILRPPADLSTVDPSVWPKNLARNAEGALALSGVDIRDLAREYGTPAYLTDEADFRARCREFADAFAGAEVHYAAKAFCATQVLGWVEQEGLALDVCTGGELAAARRAGFPAGRITFHGNNKSVSELDSALAAGVGTVVLDSFVEIARLAAAAQRHNRKQRVLIRTTVGVEAHTHEFIATAHEDQKFGFSLASGAAAEAVRRVLMLPSLELAGLHSHIGSQIFDTSGFEVSARRVVDLLRAIRDEHQVELSLIDLGGGYGIAYTRGDDPVDIPTLAGELTKIVRRECEQARLAVPRLAVEPGRAIAGPPTLTLYEVGTVKDVDGIRAYVSVDGGMSDNIRTALYDAQYTCLLASRTSTAEPMLSRVVGKHCESGDIVVRDTFLPADVVPGDLLAIAATGAYCRSLANNYNHVPRPPVVAVHDGKARLVVRRETVDDLLSLDVP
jgi:diaminopimelate decarboxylase